MKTITTILLALLICGTAFAQPSNIKKIENGLKAGKENMTVSQLFKLIEVDKEKFYSEKKIDGGQVYYVRDLGAYQKLSFATSWFDFMLLVDRSNEKIMYSTVAISGVKSGTNNTSFKQVHSSFAKHVKAHEKAYGTKIDLTNEELSPLSSFTFGTGCGWNGPLPEKGMKMFKLVKKGDKKTLMSWVKSMNPAIQAYGVMGLHFMKKMGHEVKLKKRDKKILKFVKNKKTVIDYCSNVQIEATTPMNRVLNDFYLDTIWELYKDSKFLK